MAYSYRFKCAVCYKKCCKIVVYVVSLCNLRQHSNFELTNYLNEIFVGIMIHIQRQVRLLDSYKLDVCSNVCEHVASRHTVTTKYVSFLHSKYFTLYFLFAILANPDSCAKYDNSKIIC